MPLQIQFHELGHALVAWLSSRAPALPFGFTFWREERSTFTSLCVAFLLGLLFVQADRERRPFGVLLSALAIVAWVMLTFVASNEHCTNWIIAGGVAGEFVLTALVMIAFSFPPRDLSDDLDRLIHVSGWSAARITRGYVGLRAEWIAGAGQSRVLRATCAAQAAQSTTP